MQGENQHQANDFDPNDYFTVMSHLDLEQGYTLDFVYFADELGGLPLVYSRPIDEQPYETYESLLLANGDALSGERSYGQLQHKYDYLERVDTDGTPESYFEFVVLALLGDQFYLSWHALYNDTIVLCGSNDPEVVKSEMKSYGLEFPVGVLGQMGELNLTPKVLMNDTSVTVSFLTFTKWGGFFENTYVMDSENPMDLQDVQFAPLIEYDCGIAF